jgi:hypothetical protein
MDLSTAGGQGGHKGRPYKRRFYVYFQKDFSEELDCRCGRGYGRTAGVGECSRRHSGRGGLSGSSPQHAARGWGFVDDSR